MPLRLLAFSLSQKTLQKFPVNQDSEPESNFFQRNLLGRRTWMNPTEHTMQKAGYKNNSFESLLSLQMDTNPTQGEYILTTISWNADKSPL